ncbi:E3 ubiquitin-protein ligase PUB23-like [Olea europaea var. sylvestris]|uniref:E3 ubiquitin-protein ligase PUB23-like n=1 Tax=Olea europaea var. sylvestris TaxID=158386 RepID=UPI000C1D2055|nr:E3 ubiquitin-protein ligase PUB23-like [Olea europaea var. sylvestris]
MDEIEIPSYFLCPISLEIMKDPVTLSTGITYDRESIEKWLFSQNNNTCPVTKQVVMDSELIPNIILRRFIQSEALSILYNLHLSGSGLKSLLQNNIELIQSLTSVMQSGSYDSRVYAVMFLKSMFEVADPNQPISLRPEFFHELVDILNDQISRKVSKATLKVLIKVCPWEKNRIKAVEAGAVPLLIDLLLDSSDKRASELMLMALNLLCKCAEGRAELLNHSAGLAIVSKKILRVSSTANESGIRILHSISKFSATPGVLQEMLQIGAVAKLCLVLEVLEVFDRGSKTKERAREILKLHARAWRNSSCIPAPLLASYPS